MTDYLPASLHSLLVDGVTRVNAHNVSLWRVSIREHDGERGEYLGGYSEPDARIVAQRVVDALTETQLFDPTIDAVQSGYGILITRNSRLAQARRQYADQADRLDRSREEVRRHVSEMLAFGESIARVSELAGVSRPTVTRWRDADAVHS